MLSFPLYVLLIPYGLFLLAFIIFAIFNLLHLAGYGFLSLKSILMTSIFIAGTLLILFISYNLLAQIDWRQTIDIFNL